MPRIWSGENYLSYYSLAPSPPTLSHQKITICVLAWITTGSNNLLQSQSMILYKEVMILLESPSQCFMTKSKPWQLRKITLLSEDCNMCVLAWIRIATTEISCRGTKHTFQSKWKQDCKPRKCASSQLKQGWWKGSQKNQNTYFCGFRVFCFLCPGFGGKENLMQKRSVRYKKLGSKCENKKNLWLKIDV